MHDGFIIMAKNYTLKKGSTNYYVYVCYTIDDENDDYGGG